MGSSWEDLRKRARQLENELDQKLVAFSKLGVQQGDNSERIFQDLSREIDQLLEQLTSVNEQLNAYIDESGSPSAAQLHALQRHREVLGDYTVDFRKPKSNIQAAWTRESLLRDVQKDIEEYKTGGSTSDYYLNEQGRLMQGHQMTDEAISIAVATRENLQAQRQQFQGIGSRVQGLAARVPGLNVLMRRIDMRKRRDTVILSGVIATCVMFSVYYVFG